MHFNSSVALFVAIKSGLKLLYAAICSPAWGNVAGEEQCSPLDTPLTNGYCAEPRSVSKRMIWS